ncbi:HNH endonuclease signature motif containing protein [Microlunatus endophyticus]|nr:HNH endonuclease signature motif containing protein [Microlunatus endophyticus]
MAVLDLEPKMRRFEGLISEVEAEALGARIMAAAADVAKHEAVLLDLVGEFDAIGAVDWWAGIQSTAHWLSWACSMAAGTAREHVRVARALRRMPSVREAFALGELSYSKVRELTRVADELSRPEPVATPEQHPAEPQPEPVSPRLAGLDESGLVELARACTASQLARTVAGWRAARDTSRTRRPRQRVTWLVRDDGNVQLSAVLPPEQGAAVIAAIQAAIDANTDPEPGPGEEAAEDRVSERDREQRVQQTRVEALTEIANLYLGSRPEDRSGADRTMVVIEVSAAALAEADRELPEPGEQEQRQARRDEVERYRSQQDHDADEASGPAERSRGNTVEVPTCRVRGGSALEPSDAWRALCDSTVLGIIVDQKGMPLAVGREERLITKHQRRALMIRDGCCQFPGCNRIRHLKAHHRISWLSGGRTDTDNLILLCQTHHTRVHEDHLTISPCDEPGCRVRWRFARPDGSTIAPVPAGMNRMSTSPFEFQALRDQAAALRVAYDHIHNTKHPDANRVFPVGGGAGFRLFDCVDALFSLTERPPRAA